MKKTPGDEPGGFLDRAIRSGGLRRLFRLLDDVLMHRRLLDVLLGDLLLHGSGLLRCGVGDERNRRRTDEGQQGERGDKRLHVETP
jgi:hypothetical protein